MAAILSRLQCVKPSSAGPVYIWKANLFITEPADDLAPHSAKSSAGSVMNKFVPIIPFTFSSANKDSVHFYGKATLFKMADEISKDLAALRVWNRCRAHNNNWCYHKVNVRSICDFTLEAVAGCVTEKISTWDRLSISSTTLQLMVSQGQHKESVSSHESSNQLRH